MPGQAAGRQGQRSGAAARAENNLLKSPVLQMGQEADGGPEIGGGVAQTSRRR